MRLRPTHLALAVALAPARAWAHVAAPQQSWSGPDPWMLAGALLALGLFVAGYRRLRRRALLGRPELARRGRLFALGWLVLAGATLSPLHQLGGRSFTAHMAEHELIMLAAAPLLVLARPLGVLLWAFPAPARQAFAAAGRSLA
ncbi:MAG TPA: cytochrome c oxidase assembly protein, partial [Phenylobacterium sp.]|nr:cytochrome c oxidase assembly protein [Phenylobacterium sp.]